MFTNPWQPWSLWVHKDPYVYHAWHVLILIEDQGSAILSPHPSGVELGHVMCTSQWNRGKGESMTISSGVFKGPWEFLPALLPCSLRHDDSKPILAQLLQTGCLNEMPYGTNQNLTHSLEESCYGQSLSQTGEWEVNIHYCKPRILGLLGSQHHCRSSI